MSIIAELHAQESVTSAIADDIAALSNTWELTPLGKRDPQTGEINPKAPYLLSWQNTDCDLEFINSELKSGRAVGIGLRTGKASGYVVAIDFDGQSAIGHWLEKFGEVPRTVTWTSGKPGRYQALFQVPETYWDSVKTKKFVTGEAEQLEFRYTGNQSVLPPSPHPETDGYVWINSPNDTLIADLPQQVIDYWLELIEPKRRDRNTSKPQTPTRESSTSIPPIPLENCLAKSNRDLLNGVGKGSRNDAGTALSRDLIGAADYLRSEGIEFDGDPEDLFDRFARGCIPPLPDRESDTIWRSAQKSNPSPACQTDGVKTILDAWRKKHTPKPKEELIERGIVPHAPINPAAEEDEINVAQELRESLELKNGTAPKLFGGALGYLLDIAAANFNIPPEILTFCLLPVLSSQIDSRTQLLINPGTNYRVPTIRWSGLVGETGTKKSPILALVNKPLSRQQHELHEIHQGAKDDYHEKYREWKNAKQGERGEEPKNPPPLRDVYFSDFTIESIAASLGNYPDCGSLVKLDELAQFFNSMDSYRGGKGADRQKWLSAWNGDEIKINRKTSDTIYVPQSSISILGGIQPQTITNLMSGDKSDQDGLWNRFSFMYLPHNKTEAFSETPGDLGDELDRVYRSLSQQPPEIHGFSLDARSVWKQWHDEIEDRTISEGHWLVKGTLAKFEGIAARNALILHRTLATIQGIKPAQMVERDTLELAIEWTRFELNQTLGQYKLLSIDDTDPKVARILKFIERFKTCEWIKARDVRNWWTGKTKPAIGEIRKFMSEVAKLDYAIDNEEPIESPNYQIKIKIDAIGSPSSPSKSETIIPQALECGLRFNPLVVHSSPNSVQDSPSNAGSADGLPMDCGRTTDGLNRSPRHNPYTERVREDNGLLGLPKLENKIKVGDRVERISTGDRGKLGLWGRNRKQATIELDDGTMSDWVSTADMRSLELEVN